MRKMCSSISSQDRYDEAIKIAREICDSNSDALSSRAVLAGALSEAGCLDEALRIATAAAKGAPDDARVHGALATVYVKMKDGAAALAAFERMAACLVLTSARTGTYGTVVGLSRMDARPVTGPLHK
jgi:Flp pilus assembly protein TadD